MGGGQSKTEITQLSQQLNDVIVQTVQNCEVAAEQSQTLEESNSGIWLWSVSRMEQNSDISSSCFSSAEKQLELQNNIINTIAQAASTKGVALLDAFSAPGSTAIANLTNIVRNNITMKNIQTSYTSIRQTQSAKFSNSGIIGYRQQDLIQGSKLFAAASLAEISKAGIFSKIESAVDQKASTTAENPLEFVTRLAGSITSGIASGITGTILFFAGLIVMVLLLIRYVFAGTDTSNTPNNMIVMQPKNELAVDNEPIVMSTGIEEPVNDNIDVQPEVADKSQEQTESV